MIRESHHVSTALVTAIASTLICTLGGAGCTKTKPAARPGDRADAAANATAERTGNQAATPPAESAAAQPAAAPGAAGATSIEQLVANLAAAADGDARVLVIDELGAIGQNAKPALGALASALANADPRVRWHAARAIGLIGEDARSSMPKLLALLGDPDPIVVTQAAAAIGSIREDDGRDPIPQEDAAAYAAALEPLAKTALHPDPRARRAAVRAVRRLSASLADMAPLVSRQLADADPSVVLGALHTLADMDDDAVPFLLEALKEPTSRYWAEVALAEIGPEAAPATAALATIAAEGEPQERLQAILSLAAIGEKAAAAAPVVVKVLDADDASLRLPAAFALGRIRATGADESLARAAAAGEPFLGAVASWALARIHPQDKTLVDEAIDRLTKGLASTDAEARSGCISGLSDLAAGLDTQSREQLAAAFVPLLTDPDPRVGTAAGAALIRLGPAAVPTLRSKIGDPATRLNILEILGALGPAAKPALAELMQGLSDADPQCRGDAAVALGAIGPDAAEAVPGLQKLLGDESTPVGVRYAAAYALGQIGTAAVAADPQLRALARSPDELMATIATWAALKINPQDASLFESAIPLLRRALRGDREMARLEAAVVLGVIGSAAATAIPILELVSEEDSSKPVRAAAAAALEKIRGR